ncbi:MAG TPA: CvpA family protein, partial [Arcobacter sp.]|nr:CvpA family protein [Arcobacter sp.]
LRGFIKEFFALIGLVGGVFVASRFASVTGELIDSIIPIENNNTMLLLGFVASLILFWILAFIVGNIISKVFSLSGLGIFDRFLGFVFGAGKIFLLFSIIIYALSQVELINTKLEKVTKNSIAYPLLKEAGAYIIKLDTTELQSNISEGIDTAIESSKDMVNDISTEMIEEKIQEITDEK